MKPHTLDHAAPHRRSREAGFTLIEAMIAILMLIVGLVGVTNLFVIAGNSNVAANAGTAAAAIASEQMETLKATEFNTLAAAPGGSLTADNAGFFRSTATDNRLRIAGAGMIRVRWTVAAVPGYAQLLYIVVRAEADSFLGPRTRAEYTALRSCTDPVPQASSPTGCSGNAVAPCCPLPP